MSVTGRADAVYAVAQRHYPAVSAVVAGSGVVLLTQGFGPRTLAIGLLVTGAGWYAINGDSEDKT